MPIGIASPCPATTGIPANGKWRRRRSTTSSTDGTAQPLLLPRHYLDVREAKKGVRVAAPRAPGGGDTFEVRASRDAMLQCVVGKAGPQGALGEHLRPLPGCVRVGV